MSKTIADAVKTLADVIPDRIKLADLPAMLVVEAAFDPNMGNTRTGYRFDIDGYRSVEVLVYLPDGDQLDGVVFKRDDAQGSRIAGGRRAKFVWDDGSRLVSMTVPTALPIDKVTSIKVTTTG